jgi:hypothetical protein
MADSKDDPPVGGIKRFDKNQEESRMTFGGQAKVRAGKQEQCS